MHGFIWGQKESATFKENWSDYIFFVCSLVVKPYKILCIDVTD